MTAVEKYALEADQTRARIKGTIDELSRRLDPSRLLGEAQASSSEALHRAGDFARANPVLLGVAALGIGLILFQGNRATGRSSYRIDDPEDDYSSYAEGDSYLGERDAAVSGRGRSWTQLRQGLFGAGERLGGAGETVRAGIESAAASLGHVAHDAGAFAESRLHSASAATARAANEAGAVARRALHDAEEAVEENPAAVIAGGLILGAALAFLWPQVEGDDL